MKRPLRKARLYLPALAAAGAVGFAAWVVLGLPRRSELRALRRVNPTTTSLMRQREAEARLAGRPPRRAQSWVPIARVSRHLIHAVVTAEDAGFFGHEGIDWDAVKDSLEANWERGRFARGGSTITQQLAKNLYFTTRKSLVRKLQEAIVARWLEAELEKRRILELYLNLIEWGDGVWGCEAAARRYFGKAAADLDEAEAAGLAAMIPNPRRINPRVSPAAFARARRRVLWLMAQAGYAKQAGARLGAEPPPPEPVESSQPPPPEPSHAPSASPSPDR